MLFSLFAIAIAPTVPTSNTGETVLFEVNICSNNLNDLTLDILFVSFIGDATTAGLSKYELSFSVIKLFADLLVYAVSPVAICPSGDFIAVDSVLAIIFEPPCCIEGIIVCSVS